MASLSITVDDAIVPRVREAYGVATNPELKQLIIKEIKAKVVAYEVQKKLDVERAKVQTAQVNLTTAVDAEQAKAETEIVIG